MSVGKLVGWGLAAVAVYALFGKSDPPARPPSSEAPSAASAGTYDYGGDRSEAARETAADEVSGDRFEDHGDTGQCTEDCSGHDAGFQWAAEQGVTDSSDCGGQSQSFIEGCEAYAEAVEERAREIEQDGSEAEEYEP